MSGPFEGVRVLEVAMYGFVPSAGAVMADWGADVLKVEHAVTGDPQRGLRQVGAYKVDGDPNPNFEHANRGKRSIGLDVGTPEGLEVLYELAARSDVFLTNFLPSARQRFKIDVEHIRNVNPKIIYARPARRRGGPGRLRHDGVLVPRHQRGQPHPAQRGRADQPAARLRRHDLRHEPGRRHRRRPVQAGANRGAVCRRRVAARQRPVGHGPRARRVAAPGHVLGGAAAGRPRRHVQPPVRPVQDGDGRYLSLVMLQPGKYWADVCQHIGRPELADDPRFATAKDIAANADEGARILQEAFASKTLAEWAEIPATVSGPWAPVQDTLQAGNDAQARANEYFLLAGELELVSSPVQFDVTAPQLGPAPAFAAQTEEVLQELGLDWDRIIALKAAGAVT
jgi:crotonobetainyl-CoA:carnitine CoA-transferase CaiB-like acyl-CoA transferase